MRSENEDRCLVPQSKPVETTPEFQKTLKFAYTRDFLFSLAEFDTCKNLPTGFDSSILRELGDQSTSVLLSYHDSADAGRFQSKPSHCTWRNAERGLLGSGAFARAHTGVAETSDSVLQGSGLHILNRSSEPYRPPHLCKAKNFRGRESKDHYNDETFGSSDNLSQERAEEQRRRDSFELMRKEQEMATQEKQKIITDEHKETSELDIAIVLEDSGVDKKVANKCSKFKGAKPCDVKEGDPEIPVFCSSDLIPQFLEGEKKTAVDQKATEHKSTKCSFGTNVIAHNLMKSTSTPVMKESPMHLYGCCYPGAPSSECLEESILLEINGHYSTQHHSINGRSSYDIEDSQSSYDAAHQDFLSLLQKGADLTYMAESSKLNTWSLDKPYVSETGNDNNQLKRSGRVFPHNFEKNLREPISGTLMKDSQSTALSGTQKDLTSRCKGTEVVESQIPLPVGHNCIISLKDNETGPIGDAEGIIFSGFVEQTGVNNRNGNLLVSNIQAKVGLNLQGEPESKHSSLSSFDDLDICLPDEDSLITADDYILQDSISVAYGNTSSKMVNTFDRLADCGVPVGDKRFDLAGFRSPTSFHGFHDLVNFETPFKSLHMRQSSPQLQHSQLKRAKEQRSRSKSQENLKGLRIKPQDLPTCPCLEPLQYIPANAYLTSSQHLPAAETRFELSGNRQCLQALPVPSYFLPHQSYGRPRDAFPQRTPNKMLWYAQDQNPMLNSSLNSKRQC